MIGVARRSMQQTKEQVEQTGRSFQEIIVDLSQKDAPLAALWRHVINCAVAWIFWSIMLELFFVKMPRMSPRRIGIRCDSIK